MISNGRPWIWVLFLLLFTGSAGAQTPDEALIERVNQHYRSINTFRAEYVQESESRAMGGPQSIILKDVAQGLLVFAKPDLIRLDQEKPRKEVLLSDGRFSWWYIPEENKVYKYTAQTQSGALRALADIFSGRQGFSDSFIVLVLHNNDEKIMLRLRPRSGAQDFEYLDVGLNSRNLQLKTLDITYLMGQKTNFIFSHIEEGSPVSTSLFNFIPPEGTKIIEGR